MSAYHGYDYRVERPGVHRGLPSTAATVVLSFGESLEVGWLGRPESRRRFRAAASGLSTVAAEIVQSGRQVGVQLSLTPAGVRSLLGVPLSAIATEVVALDDVTGGPIAGLWGRCAELASWRDRYHLIDEVLLAQASQSRASRGPVRAELVWAFDAIEAGGGAVPVGALAGDVGWSRRHLTRLFSDEFGLGPKELARVARFQRSRALVARGTPLGEVAAACGFADQPHLTREWRALSGYTPLQWRRAEFPFVQDIVSVDGRGWAHD